MKKIRIFAIVMAVVLSLTAGVFAWSKLANKSFAKSEASCCADAKCCEGGSCKMGGSCCSSHKSAHAAHPAIAAVTEKSETKASCCGDAACCADGKCKMGGSCCSDGASCPMKNQSSQQTAAAVEQNGKSCDRKMTAATTEQGESCCKAGASCCSGGASCCKAKTETAKL